MWFVSFEEKFDILQLIGREIILGGENIVIEDANYHWKHATFKVPWLPLGTNPTHVAEFFHEDLNPKKAL